MTTIRNTLSQLLAETGEGNHRSMSSPAMVIDLFGRYLDEYGHEDLTEFEQQQFDKEWSEDRHFCDIFDPDHIEPFHINSFLSTFVIRKVMSTKGFRKACGPVMEKLASWLLEKGHWDEDAMTYYRDIVGDDAGGEADDMATTTQRRWVVYVLRCADGSLYTGITTDLERRCQQHNAGTASRYTRGRVPTSLVHQEIQPSRSQALKREMAIKASSRQQKETLIQQVE